MTTTINLSAILLGFYLVLRNKWNVFNNLDWDNLKIGAVLLEAG